MPTCCVKNCLNRTSNNILVTSDTKGIKYFSFPKEAALRQEWLNACDRKETDMKVDSARICSIHFKESCFVLEKTKPRSPNTPAKEVLRLKPTAIPSKMLTLERKRKLLMPHNKDDDTNSKVPRTILPTYAELVQYAQQKQHLSVKKNTLNVETDAAQSTEQIVQNIYDTTMQEIRGETIQDTENNVITNMTDATVQNTKKQNEVVEKKIFQNNRSNTNAEMEALLRDMEVQLRQSEENNRKLLETNKNLKKQNEELNLHIIQVQAVAKQTATDAEKEGREFVISNLRKVLTPGQITMLMSSKSRIHPSKPKHVTYT